MGNLILPLTAILAIGIHLCFVRGKRSADRIIEITLLWLLAVVIGGSGLYAFSGHIFAADQVAVYIGWPPGNPFQYEVGVANLAIGILGLLCIWFRGNFWLATILAETIFSVGAGIIHIRNISSTGNLSSGNAGPALAFDMIAPIVLICLYTLMKTFQNRKPGKSFPEIE